MVSGEHWGLSQGVGVSGGHKGCRGALVVAGGLGAQPTLGPSPGSHHSYWFPLGSDLPGQGQASDRNELCRLLYTILELYLVTVCTFVSMLPHHIFLHAM